MESWSQRASVRGGLWQRAGALGVGSSALPSRPGHSHAGPEWPPVLAECLGAPGCPCRPWAWGWASDWPGLPPQQAVLCWSGHWQEAVGGGLCPGARLPQLSHDCVCCCCSVAQPWLTLRPHAPQHARLPCPSPYPGACANPCPLSQ